MSERRDTPRRRLIGAPGWVVSIAIHALIILLLSLVTWMVVSPERAEQVMQVRPSAGGGGIGEAAGAGASSSEAAKSRASEPASSGAEPLDTPTLDELASSLDATSSAGTSSSSSLSDLAAELADELGQGGGGRGGMQGFGGVLEGMRRRGLELVLVIDATASMQPYIEQVKERIGQIIDLLVELLGEGNVHIGAVAYKDFGDRFGEIGNPVEFVPVSEDPAEVREFLDAIVAGGGGTPPEPVHLALEQATSRAMKWRSTRARLVILVGDSPIHDGGVDPAQRHAERFARGGGIVSVIDVGGAAGRRSLQPHLAGVAQAGGGEAFLLRDEAAFWRHLIILVFGEAYRHDVDEIIDRHLADR